MGLEKMIYGEELKEREYSVPEPHRYHDDVGTWGNEYERQINELYSELCGVEEKLDQYEQTETVHVVLNDVYEGQMGPETGCEVFTDESNADVRMHDSIPVGDPVSDGKIRFDVDIADGTVATRIVEQQATCEHCGREFTQTNYHKQYCSSRCEMGMSSVGKTVDETDEQDEEESEPEEENSSGGYDVRDCQNPHCQNSYLGTNGTSQYCSNECRSVRSKKSVDTDEEDTEDKPESVEGIDDDLSRELFYEHTENLEGTVQGIERPDAKDYVILTVECPNGEMITNKQSLTYKLPRLCEYHNYTMGAVDELIGESIPVYYDGMWSIDTERIKDAVADDGDTNEEEYCPECDRYSESVERHGRDLAYMAMGVGLAFGVLFVVALLL